MVDLLSSVKAAIRKRILSHPKLYREYWFLKAYARYLRRTLSGRNEWIDILQQPPLLLGFNTIGTCNADCCYCAYKFHKPDGIMDMKLYEKGMRDFSDMGGGMIGLSPVTGEPLLDPYFSERIEVASSYDNITGIMFDTNGILLKKEKIRETLFRLSTKMRINMNISIPGFEREMYERVYNVGWDEAVLHGIKQLLITNREIGKPIEINFSLQPDKGGVLEEDNFRTYILPYLEDEYNIMVCGLRDNWCGQILQHHITGNMTIKRQLPFKRIPCEVLLDRHVDILVNGDVRMCGCRYGKKGKHDELVVGNIENESLSHIWFGERPKKLCEEFLASDTPEPCRECSMYLPF